MSRPLIITIGIVSILLVLGLWVYLLIFGTPQKPQEVFSNLGIIQNTAPSAPLASSSTATASSTATTTKLELTNKQLRQLTTRAVAGFAFVPGQTQMVRYVERGTGYVYEIDLHNGTEREVSNTTIPQTTEALFSPDTTSLVFVSYVGDMRTAAVGTLSNGGSITLQKLPLNAQNFSFKDNATLYFSTDDGTKTTGYSLDLKTSTQTTLFTQNLTDMRMVWGAGSTQMYIETKPAAKLEGYAYSITKGVLSPVSDQLPGLSVLTNGTYLVETYVNNGKYISSSKRGGSTSNQPIVMIPEKCAFDFNATSSIWCAAQLDANHESYLEDWYKGIFDTHDKLWYVDLSTRNAILIGDPFALSGRYIDVDGISLDQTHTSLLFKNKQDGTLWTFTIKK